MDVPVMFEDCPECGSTKVVEEERKYSFPYGPDGPSQVMIETTHAVFVCQDCGFGCFDHRGEEARSLAVERYLLSTDNKEETHGRDRDTAGTTASEGSHPEVPGEG